MKMYDKLTSDPASSEMLRKAHDDVVETVWERHQRQQPQCNFGQLGVCCTNCSMGPCRINPFGKSPSRGVCGATADVIVARNLLLHIATGAAAHSDHGRDIVNLLADIAENRTDCYSIRDTEKCASLAKELGIDSTDTDPSALARAIVSLLSQDFGRQRAGAGGGFPFMKRAPRKRLELWKTLGLIPRGIDREIVESLHRTHIGVDNDATSLLLQGIRTALADGWGGSMMATEISDIIFGTPRPVETEANLGVLRKDMVNIIVHGHELTLSDMIVRAASDKKLIEKVKTLGASGINVCGMCCAGNEILSRHGIPLVGNFLQQELAVITGAVEAMVVDVQCIFPSLPSLSKCYHTLFITTSPKAHFEGALRMEFNEKDALKTAYAIVETAVDNFRNRNTASIRIPDKKMKAVAGFSTKSIIDAFGGSLTLLIDAIENGTIRGMAGVVGCNNPKTPHDLGHITLVRELIANDILVISTGCNAVACGKNGLLTVKAAEDAGMGLKSICRQLNIPPVLHMGSCVDNSRILTFAGALAKELQCDISDLPIAGAAPEWMSQKAISIATYMLGSGIYTVLGVIPPILGSKNVTELLCTTIESVTGAKFTVETDPVQAAAHMINHIETKRSGLFSSFKVLELETIKTSTRRQKAMGKKE